VLIKIFGLTFGWGLLRVKKHQWYLAINKFELMVFSWVHAVPPLFVNLLNTLISLIELKARIYRTYNRNIKSQSISAQKLNQL
jgi:hypothetical protein